jgi:putative spermidine/putrescine transport system permease protein
LSGAHVVETTQGAEPQSRARSGRLRKLLRAELLLILPLAFVGFFFFYPLLQMVLLSVQDFLGGAGHWYDNYKWFLGNPSQRTIFRRTFLVSIWVTLVCLAAGFPYAYLMTLVGKRTRLLMLAAVMLPFWSNLVVRTYAWVVLLQDNGPVRSAFAAFGVHLPRLLGNMTGVTIGATQVLLPFLVLPLYATLQGIDRRLLDAAESLGAKPRTAFIKIYLPLALPGILAGCLIVFILMLGFYFTPALLGSPSNSLISQQIFIQVNRLLAFGRGGAMALVLLITTLCILAISALFTRRYTKALGIGGEG